MMQCLYTTKLLLMIVIVIIIQNVLLAHAGYLLYLASLSLLFPPSISLSLTVWLSLIVCSLSPARESHLRVWLPSAFYYVKQTQNFVCRNMLKQKDGTLCHEYWDRPITSVQIMFSSVGHNKAHCVYVTEGRLMLAITAETEIQLIHRPSSVVPHL